ncbi:MAG: MCP four helix bundle domain-containing protein [Cryobacterium sp.]|nr:MCP four helix bundle domain-containing protein [Oligoflexia bacterium]
MNKLALSTKLYASFTLQLAFIAGIGAVGFYSVTQVTNQYRRVVEVNVPKEKILVDLRMVQKDVVIAVRTAAGADTPAAVNEQAKALEESGARFEKASEKFESMELSETETKLWNGVKENWKPLMEVSTKIMSLSRSENADDHTKRDQMVKVDFDTARKNVRVPVEALKEFQTKDSEASNQSAQDSGNYSKTLMIISAAMGIFFGLFAAISLTRGINRNLNHITA